MLAYTADAWPQMKREAFLLERSKRELEYQKQRDLALQLAKQRQLESDMEDQAAAEAVLNKERKCKHCGTVFTRKNNRPGKCKHFGQWHNWGVDPKTREKKEWIHQWSCCGSHDFDSQCYRSGNHEE